MMDGRAINNHIAAVYAYADMTEIYMLKALVCIGQELKALEKEEPATFDMLMSGELMLFESAAMKSPAAIRFMMEIADAYDREEVLDALVERMEQAHLNIQTVLSAQMLPIRMGEVRKLFGKEMGGETDGDTAQGT